MNIDFSPGQSALRAEIRHFLANDMPATLRDMAAAGIKIPRAEHLAWQARLRERGWLAPSWSAEWGGTGWGPVERLIFDEESWGADMPRANVPGLELLGPVLIEFGTPRQKEFFLPRILSGEHWWCQGFSEPEAGSDLASLRMTARRDGDSYVVSGTKIWTSYAHDSNWIFCLVRTSSGGAKQGGISFLLVPMDARHVQVRPIVTAGGVHVLNQVVIDEARVPDWYLLGGEGQGWKITKFLLGHERLIGAGLGPSTSILRRLKRILKQTGDADLRERLAGLEIDLMALKFSCYRVLADQAAGRAPGPEVSVLKVKGAEVQQNLAELLMQAMGPAAYAAPDAANPHMPLVPEIAYAPVLYFDRRKLSIYGGSSEIQRNIIAKQLLGIR